MYGLPPGLDVRIFEGVELLQICTGANEVILHFDEDISITIESSIRIHGRGGDVTSFSSPRAAAPFLNELLSAIVTGAEGRRDGTLHLDFSTGQAIEILDDLENYESYQVGCSSSQIQV